MAAFFAFNLAICLGWLVYGLRDQANGIVALGVFGVGFDAALLVAEVTR